MAQFTMVAYYVLGGPYSLQGHGDAHVRMDLFYGSWSARTKAIMDAFTIFFLIFFLCVLLWGAFDSTSYAFQYNERSSSAWRPLMWPVKVTMCVGFTLMLLQAVAEFLKDIARIRGGSS
jgi:TRAP-type mannitol/chloroaromatic compound transport system permease small subunit